MHARSSSPRSPWVSSNCANIADQSGPDELSSGVPAPVRCSSSANTPDQSTESSSDGVGVEVAGADGDGIGSGVGIDEFVDPGVAGAHMDETGVDTDTRMYRCGKGHTWG